MKRFLFLSCLVIMSSVASSARVGVPYKVAEDTIFRTDRAPLFMKFGLIQKSYRPADIQLEDVNQDFRTMRSHSIGFLSSMEFGLNRVPNFDRLATLETTFGFSSYSFRATGTVDAEDFGLDADAKVIVQRYIPATEFAVKLNQYRRLGKKSFIIAGMGVNIQSIPFHNRFIRGVARVSRDGRINTETVLSNRVDDPFFGFTPRGDAPVTMGFLATAGIGWTSQTYNVFRLEFRYSSTKTGDVVDAFQSDFGLASDVFIDKSYIGLDISYTFCVNHRLAKKSMLLNR